MKKLLCLSTALLLASGGVFAVEKEAVKAAVSADGNVLKIVTIDSINLMQKSKEGKLLTERIQKDITEFQTSVKKAQDELIELQEKVSKQAKVLSKEALLEKGEELAKKKKSAERDLTEKEESLKMSVQRQQLVLRDKQMKIASEVFDKNGWDMMMERSTPGLFFVSKSVDKTESVLAVVDQTYDKEIAEKLIEKSKAKTVNAS